MSVVDTLKHNNIPVSPEGKVSPAAIRLGLNINPNRRPFSGFAEMWKVPVELAEKIVLILVDSNRRG
jgi:hypothetical protein